MASGAAPVQDADIPPQPAAELRVEGFEPEDAAVAVQAHGTRDVVGEGVERPGGARGVLVAQGGEEEHEGLEGGQRLGVEQVGAGEGLFGGEAVAVEGVCARGDLGGWEGDEGGVVDCEEEGFGVAVERVEIGEGGVVCAGEGGEVEDGHERRDVGGEGGEERHCFCEWWVEAA